MRNQLPIVAVTMGDPAGIGPEIALKAVAEGRVTGCCRPVIIGDLGVLAEVRQLAGLPVDLISVTDPGEVACRPGVAHVLDRKAIDAAAVQIGRVSAAAGRAAIEYLAHATRLALSGAVDAISTAPIHKEAIHAAGIAHIGHTEWLQAATGASDVATMFVNGRLHIFFLTRHVSLREACDLVTRDRVARLLRTAHRALKQLGRPDPVIAVAGLNPHSGDGGLMGREELDEIKPAMDDVAAEGIRTVGPLPADSVFVQAYRGRWDAVLALYHDQGHIASKALDFERTVSVTIGLPFIRTSVDHGTAFDIAGTGKADATSMTEAILVAARLARLAAGRG